MEGHCSTGQGPQLAVAPMEEEKEEEFYCWMYFSLSVPFWQT